MKPTIALLYGGYSSEFEVSVKSAANVYSVIDKDKYDIRKVLVSREQWTVVVDEDTLPIDKTDFTYIYKGVKCNFDLALIMIHGDPGENGLLQAYFELIGQKYLGCSFLVSALVFDKYICKSYLRDTRVSVAKDILVRKGDRVDAEKVVEELKLPIFVKPNSGGSSFGITKVKQASDLDAALDYAFGEGETVILEEAIVGREITCGVFSVGGKCVTLPPTEIISDNEYFDYQAKYEGASKEVCPADISEEMADLISQTTSEIYHFMGCKGLVRMDYIVREDEVFFLEINPIPGMTHASLVPQQLRTAHIDVRELYSAMIEDAL